MPNQIQVELDGKTINLTVSDDQMSIVSDDGREFVAKDVYSLRGICSGCAFRNSDCDQVPCLPEERADKSDKYFIELT
ncbi:MAG: hypothetical protein ACRDC6_19965 [Shewanella sp.]